MTSIISKGGGVKSSTYFQANVVKFSFWVIPFGHLLGHSFGSQFPSAALF